MLLFFQSPGAALDFIYHGDWLGKYISHPPLAPSISSGHTDLHMFGFLRCHKPDLVLLENFAPPVPVLQPIQLPGRVPAL